MITLKNLKYQCIVEYLKVTDHKTELLVLCSHQIKDVVPRQIMNNAIYHWMKYHETMSFLLKSLYQLIYLWFLGEMAILEFRRGPAQDVPFFHTPTHLSEQQKF